MDGLRWLLLIFGALVVAGVYFYTRRERQQPKEEPVASPRITPTLGDEPEPEISPEVPEPVIAAPVVEEAAPEVEAHEGAEEEVTEEESPAPQKIVTLRVVAKNKGAFPGDELILALRGIGMRSGKSANRGASQCMPNAGRIDRLSTPPSAEVRSAMEACDSFCNTVRTSCA